MNQVDIFELKRLLKRMGEIADLWEKAKGKEQKEFQKSFNALANQFKKRVSEIK